MSSMNSLFAEFGVHELRGELRAAGPTSASHKSHTLSSLIRSIDTQNRQRTHRPTLPRQSPIARGYLVWS